MKKVKDINGQEVKGIFRGSKGELIVKDPSELEKYKKIKYKIDRDQKRLESIESELRELKLMLCELIQNAKSN